MLELTDDTQAGACPWTILLTTDMLFLPGCSQLHRHPAFGTRPPTPGKTFIRTSNTSTGASCKYLPLEQALELREIYWLTLDTALWGDLETSHIYEQSDADGKTEHLSSSQPHGHCALIASLRGFAILPFLPPTAS